MKLLQFRSGDQTHLGLKLPEGVLDLSTAGYTRDLVETIRDYDSVKEELLGLAARVGAPLLQESSLDYLPAAPAHAAVLCVGLNYKLHIEEASRDLDPGYPEYPVLFSKFSNALNSHEGIFHTLPSASNYDYEAELAIIMGKSGMNIPVEKAGDYIFGYSCGNDITAREAQRLSSQWLIGKSLPGSAPVGPWIVTKEEINPSRLAISCYRDGVCVQSSNTDQMIFDVYAIVSFASRYLRLEAGDVILTGTPNGVIMGMEAQEQNWLKAGDTVTVTIENIGSLVTRFA